MFYWQLKNWRRRHFPRPRKHQDVNGVKGPLQFLMRCIVYLIGYILVHVLFEHLTRWLPPLLCLLTGQRRELEGLFAVLHNLNDVGSIRDFLSIEMRWRFLLQKAKCVFSPTCVRDRKDQVPVEKVNDNLRVAWHGSQPVAVFTKCLM